MSLIGFIVINQTYHNKLFEKKKMANLMKGACKVQTFKKLVFKWKYRLQSVHRKTINGPLDKVHQNKYFN